MRRIEDTYTDDDTALPTQEELHELLGDAPLWRREVAIPLGNTAWRCGSPSGIARL